MTPFFENHKNLGELVFQVILEGEKKTYNLHNPHIEQGETYGIFRNDHGVLKIHNRVYELLIYDYLTSKIDTTRLPVNFFLQEITTNFQMIKITSDNNCT